MSQGNTSKISQDIVGQAAEWFVEFRLDEPDAQARQRFMEWLRLSPLHIRAYLEIAGTYADMAPAGVEMKLDVDQLIAAARVDANVVPLKDRLDTQASATTPPQRPAQRGNWRRPLAYAASLLLLAVATGWLWHWQVGETYATQIGEQRSLMLADGSQVDLNARSQIRVRLEADARYVDLVRGQAFFKVAKDSNRPFIVSAADARIRAVGTAFDVNRARSGTTVTVLEGRVAVLSHAKSDSGSADVQPSDSPPPAPKELLLSAGEQVRLSPAVVWVPQPANVAATTAWTQRKLVFDGTPLQDVIEEFNRYNSRQLVIDDRPLDQFLVSGYYATPDPASLLAFLRSEPTIRVIESEDEVHIALK